MTQRIGLWALLTSLASSSLAAAQQPPPQEPPPQQPPPAEAPEQPAPAEPAEPTDPTEPAPQAPPAEPAPEAPESIDPAPPVPLPSQDLPGETAPIDATQATTPDEAEIIAPEEVGTVEPGQDIIVTGTRIRRSSAFAPSAAVEVIGREQLEYSGATNLADVVQYLTVSQGAGSQGAPTPLQGGTVQINLRGLGAGATLILLNGRRINPSAGGVAEHFGDIATIPMAAVERIEILKGGASAIYGADAVGGVVNIITRKNFDGVRVEIDGQTTDKLDQQDVTASLAFGATSERSRVMVAASYFRRTELTADERDFTRDSYISTQGNPGTYIVGFGTEIDPACEGVEGSFVQPGAAGDLCAFEYRRFASLLGNAERANAIGSAEYDLTNHTTLFGEINVSRLRGDALGSTSLPIPPPFPIVPADHVDNPFGTAAQWIGRPLGAEAGGQRNSAADDTFRGTIGLKGDLEGAAEDTVFENWEWEVFSTFGISRYHTGFNDNLLEPLQNALNSCSDPSDLSGCFNPFYSAIDGTGTPNSPEIIDSFSGKQVNTTDHALQTYNAGMSGPLFELPGGDFGIAFGTEIRHEWRTSELDHDANEDRYGFVIGNPDAKVARDVYSGYLELRWPFYDGIELQTAARLEHYTDTDSTPISPSAGLTLTPAEIAGRDNVSDAFRRLQLRGHVTSAFRAPTIYQSFPGYATIPTPLLTGGPLPTYIPVRSFGNPNLEPERALALSGGLMWSPIEQIGLTADVWHYDYQDRIDREDPQQIFNESGGMDDPRIIREEVAPGRFDVARINVRQLNLEGSVVTNGIDFGLMFNLDGEEFGGSETDFGLSFGAQGTYTMTYDIPRGQQAQLQLPDGTFVEPVDCEGDDDEDTCHVAGHRNENNFAPPIPQLRVNFPVVFTASGHSATVVPRYISGMKDDVQPNMDRTLDDIDAWFAIDLQYAYTIEDFIGDELTARIGVYNLLDADPPAVNGAAVAHETRVHDPRGRMVYAKLVTQF